MNKVINSFLVSLSLIFLDNQASHFCIYRKIFLIQGSIAESKNPQIKATAHPIATPKLSISPTPTTNPSTTPKPSISPNDTSSNKKEQTNLIKGGKLEVQKDVPTLIDSDALDVDQNTRVFKYSGNVKVVQGDMTLTSDYLVGIYNDQNKIKDLTATKNVVITKGESIKATSEKAYYEADTSLVTLTINPQLFQEGSILTAEKIKINLDANQSSAEGKVRVKLVNSDKPGGSKSAKELFGK